MIAKPNFHSRSVFAENLTAVEMRKLEVQQDLHGYVHILDKSKVCLYEFYHEYILPIYREKCKIMYIDSFIYHKKCDDVYDAMKRDIARFDMSDYSDERRITCMPLMNKKVSGLMKDENNGVLIIKFIGFRTKMYAVRVDNKKDIKKV